MNKRIKELMEQTGGEFYEGFLGSPNSIKFTEEDLEKFAVSIARECFWYCRENGGLSSLPDWEGLMEHFGVEE